MPRIVYVVNNVEFLLSHRGVLLKGARAAGYDVHVVGPSAPGSGALSLLGFPFHEWNVSRKGQSPLSEALSVSALTARLSWINPDIVHNVTIKPIIYGSFAARAARVRGVVNAVSGLGFVFMARGAAAQLRRALVAKAYRLAFSTPNSVVVLQNDDDEADLRAAGAIGEASVVKIRGSGVDLEKYHPTPEPIGVPVVVCPARLLRDKGIVEFVEAARYLKSSARMVLVGGLDEGNPTAISRREVEGWVREGVVEWWGHRVDMDEVYRQANIVCLPSYREGLSRALLEAAASARAIVTTDAPGCRDAVGRAGHLVPVRDGQAVAGALRSLLDPAVRAIEAKRLRRLAEEQFSEAVVLTKHLEVYDQLARLNRSAL